MPSVKHELWISFLPRRLIEIFTLELRIERRWPG